VAPRGWAQRLAKFAIKGSVETLLDEVRQEMLARVAR
jgi:hypothetical protein